MNAGYIYVLINASMPGLIKVGMTTNTPEERAEQLSSATGVPTPFVVAYQRYVNDCAAAEEFVHMFLAQQGYRINPNREFFDAPLTETINAIISYKDNCSSNSDFSDTDTEKNTQKIDLAENELHEGYRYLYGIDDCFIDTQKAIKHFKSAAKLGSVEANSALAQIYSDENPKLALDYLQRGANLGDLSCYHSMLHIYFNIWLKTNDSTAIRNFEKSLVKYAESGLENTSDPFEEGSAYSYVDLYIRAIGKENMMNSEVLHHYLHWFPVLKDDFNELQEYGKDTMAYFNYIYDSAKINDGTPIMTYSMWKNTNQGGGFLKRLFGI